MAKIEEDGRDREDRDRGVNQPTAQKNAEAIGEITHRLGQEGIDLTLANVGGNLPFVLGRGDEVAHQNREQIIINHRTVVVAAHTTAAFAENRPPKEDCADERNDPEDCAQQIVPAIDKGVLDPEIEDSEILLQLHGGISTADYTGFTGRNPCHLLNPRLKLSFTIASADVESACSASGSIGSRRRSRRSGP